MTDVIPPKTLALLVARSRKLGADRSICNWGGGNTSAKSDEIDFRGRRMRILWVKGSGSDLATVTEASFTGLYLDDVLSLFERERMSDSEMVDYLAHCFYEPGRPRPSIETLLHGSCRLRMLITRMRTPRITLPVQPMVRTWHEIASVMI